MFDFDFRLEIYTPKAKRVYGFFVMPVLHGDTLIGRIDPSMDRKKGILTVNAIHSEPGLRSSASATKSTQRAIEDLARFLGAKEVRYPASK
jgi:uncharacterized protein YcaQ